MLRSATPALRRHGGVTGVPGLKFAMAGEPRLGTSFFVFRGLVISHDRRIAANFGGRTGENVPASDLLEQSRGRAAKTETEQSHLVRLRKRRGTGPGMKALRSASGATAVECRQHPSYQLLIRRVQMQRP
jgi:hypothetical protein